MVSKEQVLEMRIWAPEFKLPCKLDKNFTYIEINEYTKKSDLNEILESINKTLPDWNNKPTHKNLKDRFKAGCSCILQYYNKSITGWFWTCNFVTYDWVKKIKELPTLNSNFSGGTYIIKEKSPNNAGLQLYSYCIREVMSRTDYGYAYVDRWNKASIRLQYNCGATVINNLL